jgi:hypothetical protein
MQYPVHPLHSYLVQYTLNNFLLKNEAPNCRTRAGREFFRVMFLGKHYEIFKANCLYENSRLKRFVCPYLAVLDRESRML